MKWLSRKPKKPILYEIWEGEWIVLAYAKKAKHIPKTMKLPIMINDNILWFNKEIELKQETPMRIYIKENKYGQ